MSQGMAEKAKGRCGGCESLPVGVYEYSANKLVTAARYCHDVDFHGDEWVRLAYWTSNKDFRQCARKESLFGAQKARPYKGRRKREDADAFRVDEIRLKNSLPKIVRMYIRLVSFCVVQSLEGDTIKPYCKRGLFPNVFYRFTCLIFRQNQP